MKQIEFLFNTEFQNNSILSIILYSEVIESYSVSSKVFSDSFTYNNISYIIDFTISDSHAHVIIKTESEDSDLMEFLVVIDEIPEDTLNIDYYVPTAPYTGTLTTALYGFTNDKVVPLIDVENEKKFADYLDDELLDFEHYLDLSSIKYITNEARREEIKETRKQEKKEHGRMLTPLPQTLEDVRSIEDRIIKYKSIENKNLVIPVYLWNEQGNITDLRKFIDDLGSEGFPKFAIRLLSKTTFFSEIEEVKSIYNFVIFMDLNTNFNTSNISTYITSLYLYFNKIIYLGAHFLPTQMTISRDSLNENHIRNNYPLEVYQALNKKFPDLSYGDYCGFDRKTLSSMPKGGRPSARVILVALDKSRKVLIRRGWDDKDETTTKSGEVKIGMIYSMHKLLCDIKHGDLDYAPTVKGHLFMNSLICDADEALKSYCPDRTTPGEVKTLCIRHNIFSVIHNYINS